MHRACLVFDVLRIDVDRVMVTCKNDMSGQVLWKVVKGKLARRKTRLQQDPAGIENHGLVIKASQRSIGREPK